MDGGKRQEALLRTRALILALAKCVKAAATSHPEDVLDGTLTGQVCSIITAKVGKKIDSIEMNLIGRIENLGLAGQEPGLVKQFALYLTQTRRQKRLGK